MPDLTDSKADEVSLARAIVKRVCSEATRRAGGPGRLVQDLATRGLTGHHGEEYSEDTVQGWNAGRRIPGSVLFVVLALQYQIPFDGIVTLEESAEEHRRALRALEEGTS